MKQAKPSKRTDISRLETRRATWRALWTIMQSGVMRGNSSVLPADHAYPFAAYAWKGFDVPHVISLLLSNEPSYFCHKKSLFAAFCAWVVAPRDNRFRRSAIATKVADAMARAQRTMKKKLEGDDDAFIDFYLIGSAFGPDFPKEIYYPMGGLRAVRVARTSIQLKRAFVRRSENLPYLVTMMRVNEFHLAQLRGDKRFRKDSMARTGAAVECLKLHKSKLRQKKVGGAVTMKTYWKAHAYTIAFLRAAADIYVTEKQSLLERLLAGEASFDSDYRYFEEWMGKTAYVKQILESLDLDTTKYVCPVTPPAPPREVAAYKFTALQVQGIRHAYAYDPKKFLVEA